MSGRSGFPIKNIAYAVVGLLVVYMMYIYHGASNNLHEAEMTGARYKREAEERVTEIQDLVKTHDKFQESCEKEKRELQNSINSVNTKYQMLESHQKDTEADLNTIKQHMETMKQEHSDAYTQHAQEYQSLKQEKDNEIARIKDQLADAQRKNSELENTIESLRQHIQREENDRDQLQAENNRLHQSLASRKQVVEQHQQLQDQKHALGDSLTDKKYGDSVYNMKVDDTIKNKGVIRDSLTYKNAPKPVLPQDNDLNQVRPPKMNGQYGQHDTKDIDQEKASYNIDKHEINPNDEHKAQIREPIIPNKDKKPDYGDDGDSNKNDDDKDDGFLGGGEADEQKRNARKEEEDREADVLKEEEEETERDRIEAAHHNPLDLKQLEVPGNLGKDELRKEVQEDEDEMNDRGGPGVGAGIGQQLPPAFNREAQDNFGENNMKVRKAINPEAP